MNKLLKSILVLLAFILLNNSLYSKELEYWKKKPDTSKIVAKDSTKKDTAKKETFADKIKSCRIKDGLFKLYQDTATGALMIYVQKKQLGNEYLYQSFSMGGPTALFLNQNMLRETWLFKIRKNFDKIYWSRSNTNFYYNPNHPISKAANVDVAETVFYVEKIISEDSLGYLINGDNLFLSEKLDPVKPFVPPTIPANLYLSLGSLVKEKSEYSKIRSFPLNTDVVVNLSYENPNPQNFGGNDITDARYINIKMQHSFIALPENDFTPRKDHPHVGYFTVQSDDMTSTDLINYRDFITRWHLKKKNPDQAISEPVEPIVWWVENTTPIELRPIIVEAGLRWNAAFEKAGFKNAIVMKIMPDNAEWDPADIRYNVIRWVSSNMGYAIGPSFVNPRTGQILGADITVDFDFLTHMDIEGELYADYNKQIFQTSPSPMQCQMGLGLKMQQQFANSYLDLIDAGESEKKELLRQFIIELVMHEMGHTLGLMHNMKASYMLNSKELKDKNLTQKTGVTASVMDYTCVNVALDPTQQANYYTEVAGPYDHWAIEYGYTPFAKDKEQEGLNKIVKRSNDPKLLFANDADICFPGNGIDPRVMVWDLSNEPVKYAEERYQIIDKNMSKLKSKYIKPGESYAKLRNLFFINFGQRGGMTFSLASYVGGIYVDRSYPDQSPNSKPYTPVPEEQQRQAVQLISKYIFAPNAFKAEEGLYQYVQAQRRGFGFFGNSEDPKIDAMVGNIQNTALMMMLFPSNLRRLSNTQLYGNTYNINDLLTDLYDGVFAADLSGSVNNFRQSLQRNYVAQLINLYKGQTGASGIETRPAVYSELKKINKKLKKSKGSDPSTKAHRKYLRHMINEALEIDR